MSLEVLNDDLDVNGHAIIGNEVRIHLNKGGSFVISEGDQDNVISELSSEELATVLNGGGGGGGGGGGVGGYTSERFALINHDSVLDGSYNFDLFLAPKDLIINYIFVNTWSASAMGIVNFEFFIGNAVIPTASGADIEPYGNASAKTLVQSIALAKGELLRLEVTYSGSNESDTYGLDVYLEWGEDTA